MKKNMIISMLALMAFISPVLSQTPDIYWGLDWKMSVTQVDSVFQPILKEKKIATKTNYTDNRQLSGYSYRVDEKGIAKIYVWFNSKGSEKVSIHSIEIYYSFDYPYDAQRFLAAYSEKYGHEFMAEPELYQLPDGGSVLLRKVKEPVINKLGQSVYQVSLFSPIPFEMSEEDMDFLF
ncbi:MAG: hypothetical protein K9N35_10305 [Candidatus Marinimicrobia bacterium]|nr:hypothetical protein [Candidatus Neomarinimicrobiota bacterium]